ncbi:MULTISPECIES: phosphoenolpyruvate hydrolase family protein [unclassified Sinorhizobium]|uniref:phosphoenolpyruvate hydrolase family protein n=1 Tax=unclassified Sinorhizobium TaxID=2613772 RepID=UPI0035235991
MKPSRSARTITATWPPNGPSEPEVEWIFCPWLEGLPHKSSLWIASLPIHDANAVLLDAIASQPFRSAPRKPDFVGACLVDPFRQLDKLFSNVMAAGISGMVNLPTTGTFRGSMARALDDLGSGMNREIAMLALARDRGLRIGGVATVPEISAKMVEVGCEFVLDLKSGIADRNIPLISPAGR